MVMKLLITLSVLAACSMAVPNPPSTFQTKISTQIWNGSLIVSQSIDGCMAQDYDRQMFITCSNYTTVSDKLQTECYMTIMRTPDLVAISYTKFANGTVIWCQQTDLGEMDFYSIWDWLPYSMPVGKCSNTCYQDLNQWQYNISNISSITLGVSDSDPNTPVSYNYTVNLDNMEIQQDIFCFSEFTSEVPPYSIFAIPNNCQSATPQAMAQQQRGKKSKIAHYLQHQMKLNRRVHPRL